MGQQIGKASFEEDVKPFLNLSAPAINAVWTAFNLSAEAWGLRASSFVNICRPLAPFLGFDDPTMQMKANSLFTLLDTDLNGIVDALEFMGCLAMVSAMEPADKIKFVYTVYDFSEKGSLLVDEITLAIKSTVEGLCKVSKLPTPGVAACENLARLSFAANGKAAAMTAGGTLTLAEFLAYVDANPTAASWVAYFDDIPDSAGDAPAPPSVFVTPTYPTRTPLEAGFLAGRGPPANLGAKAGSTEAQEWFRAPVIDDSYIPGEGDDDNGDGSGNNGLEDQPLVKYLDPGTPCFAAVQQLLKPEETRRTIATAPDSQLALDWVFGVSTLGRGAVRYCGKDDESIVYPAGAVAVQYRFPNEEQEETEAVQRHFTDHADSITALAVSGSDLVATADCRSGFGGPRVMLWRATKSKNVPVGVLGGAGLWADGCPPFALDFSPDGSKILTVAKALPRNSNAKDSNAKDTGAVEAAAAAAASFFVTVHDVNTKACVFALTTKSSVFGQVFDGKWCAVVESRSAFVAKGGVSVDGPKGSFALATSKGITFFAPTPGGASSFEPRKGVAGSRTKVEALLSLCALGGKDAPPESMACGGMSGNLYRYQGRNVAECVKAHNAPVTCLTFLPGTKNAAGGGASRLFSGSMDCSVKVWDARTLAPVATLDLMALGSSLGREVLSVDVGGNGAKCLVATSAAEVWELSAVGGGPGGDDPEEDGGGGDEGGDSEANAPGKSLHPGGGPLFNGHFAVRGGGGVVACLSASPNGGEFCSGGSDGTLRVYDSTSHQVARMQQLTPAASQGHGQGGVRCVAYSPDGSQLAAAVAGSVEIFDPSALETRVARVPSDADDNAIASRSPVQLIRFSPDGASLAVLDESAVLSVYLCGSWSLLRSFDLSAHLPADSLRPRNGPAGVSVSALGGGKGKCPGVCDVDVSEDGAWVQVGTNLLETFYFSTETGQPAAEPALATLRTAAARFPTCGPGPSKIAHEKQGSHPRYALPADVTVCCANPEAKLQLVGDVWGGVHLFNYPSSQPFTEGQTWQAHSPGVNGVCFVSGDEHVATCGSTDLVVFQWKLDVDEVRDKPKELGEDDEEVGEDEDEDAGSAGPKLQDPEDPVEEGEDYTRGQVLGQGSKPPLFHALVTRDASAALAVVQATAAQHEGNPYGLTSGSLFAAAVPPTLPPVSPQEPPKDGLRLEWVHGGAGGSVRGGVRYNAKGEIVYPAATLAVVLNKGDDGGGGDDGDDDENGATNTTKDTAAAAAAEGKKTQRYVSAHTEAVTCLAMHPQGVLVATGQRGPKPFVALSDSLTGRVCLRLEPALREGVDAGAVTAVAFSPDGSLVAFATCDEGCNTVHVFGVDDGALRCQGASGAEGKVLGLAWAPDGSGRLLACGVNHFNLWFCSGRSLSRKRGVFGEQAVKQTLLCCCWLPSGGGDDGSEPVGVLGAQDGSLFKLDGGRSISEAVDKVHSGGVTALYAFKPFEEEGPCLCSGGRDGVVKLLGADCQEAAVTINLRDKKYGCYRWHVKSVCLNKDGRKVLIGTSGSEVFEISATEEAVDLNKGALTSGHCRKGLKGVASHPMQQEYCTVGEDRTVRVWSVGDKKLSRMLGLEGGASSVAYSPDGYLVAVGMADGSVCVVSLLKPELDVVKELKAEGSSGPVTSVKFSPSGKVLACATDAGEDGSRVVFYDCENTSSPGGAFTLKSKFVLASVGDACAKAAASSGGGGGGSGGGGRAAEELSSPFQLSSPAAMDFSSDSTSLQVATSFGVAYVSVDNGSCVGLSSASSLAVSNSGQGLPPPTADEACVAVLKAGALKHRDDAWATYTVPGGWACQGLYPPGSSPGDVVSVCRGNTGTGTGGGGGSVAVATDVFGSLSLVSWPCPSPTDQQTPNSAGSSGSPMSDAANGGGADTGAGAQGEDESGSGASSSSVAAAVPGGGGEAPKRQYWGHGAALGGACFVVGDTHVISIGAEDRCVLQWATSKPSLEEAAALEAEEVKAAKAEAASKQGLADADDDLDWEAAEAAEKKRKLAEEEASHALEDARTNPDVVLELFSKAPKFSSLGDQGAAFDPAKLSFVHGLSTLRGACFVNADGNVVHCAGSLGVVYAKKRHTQVVFSGHHAAAAPTPMVRVLACQNDVGFRFGACAATGDASGDVRVWDACTAVERCRLPFFNGRLHGSSEVSALGFSHAAHFLGSFLVSVGDDPAHTLGVWQSPKRDWSDPVLVTSAQAGSKHVGFVAWAASSGSASSGGKKGKAQPQQQYDFALGGAKGKGGSSNSGASAVQFWTLAAGNVRCVGGSYASGLVEEELATCGIGLGKSTGEGQIHLQLLAVGGASGRLLLWEGTTCVRAAKAHDSAVTDLKIAPLDVSPRQPQDAQPGRYKGRIGVVSSGLDGFVKVWAVAGVGGEASLALSSAFDVASECVPRPLRSSVCAVAVDGSFTKMAVVTASSELVEVVRDSRATVHLLSCHAPALVEGGGNGGGGVSGGVARGCCSPIAPHPTESDLLASGGSDGTVRLWSRSGRCGLAVLEIGSPVAAVCWVPDPADAPSTGESGGLLVSLAPSGSLVHVSVDLGTMALAKSRVVCPSLSPVPHALFVDVEGKLIKAASAGSGSSTQPAFLELSNGKAAPEIAAALKATWYGEVKGVVEGRGGSDADGACLFMY